MSRQLTNNLRDSSAPERCESPPQGRTLRARRSTAQVLTRLHRSAPARSRGRGRGHGRLAAPTPLPLRETVNCSL